MTTPMQALRRGNVALRTCLALWALLLCAVPALAQSDNARITGTVTDSSNAVISGASVTVTSLDTGRSVTAETNGEGNYTVPALTRGRYKIEVKRDSFKSVTQEVVLEVAQNASLDFTLEPGASTDVIEVNSGVPLVDSSNSAIGKVIEGRQILELPLNGRNFTQLATLIPGVTRGTPGSSADGSGGNAETFRNGNNGGAALSVNGVRPQANNFLLDGVDNNESLVNTIVIIPPTEAIQEFRVQTSVAPAEFGRSGGALINASIRSGSNQYHGSAFNYLRNDALDARETFSPQKSEFRRNEFGGTLGGPILRDRLFAFGDYQGLRQFQPQGVDRATVPTPLMRTGNFSELLNPALNGGNVTVITDPITGLPFAGNIIPAGRINAAGRNYLNAFPLPNNGTQIQQNFITTRNQVQDFNVFDIRVDWNISQKDQMFGRFSYGNTASVTSSRLPNLPAGFGSGANFNRTRGVAIGETHTFSPNLVNEFRFGFARTFYGFQPPFADRNVSADLGIVNANTSSLLGGGALIGGFNGQIEYTGDFGPFLVPQNTFNYSDTLSYTRGQHNFKFGANVIRRQVNLFRPNRGKGFFFIGPGTGRTTGYEVSELLVGFVDNYSIGPPFGTVGTRNWETGFFAQDDWRVTNRLTLNLGIRYDIFTFPTEVANRQANFDIATGRLLVAGQNGNSGSLIPTDRNNFAPRVGLAYDVLGNNKLILRGGYGIFYFLDRGGIDNQLAQNPPFSGFSQFNFDQGFRITFTGQGPLGTGATGNLDSRLATNPLPTGSTAGLNLNNPQNVTVFAALPTNRNSYVHQYNGQAQYQLTSDTALSVGYVGVAGRKLVTYYNLNVPAFRNDGVRVRRFPNLGDVNVQDTRGTSNYNSLQVQLDRRFSKGWQYLASYTWSHTIDDSPGLDGQRPQDVNNIAAERSSSNQDFRHRLVFSTLYELPFGKGRMFGSNIPTALDYVIGGWQVNAVLLLQSGFPFSVTANGDPGNLRADVIRESTVNGGAQQYFSVGSFAAPPTVNGLATRPGTSGRNILVGPGTKNLDLSLIKNFRVTERVNVRFGTDFFNLTNTTQLGNPSNNINNGDVGQIRGTRFRSNRQIQFSLRVSF
jgi:hypothetical protein